MGMYRSAPIKSGDMDKQLENPIIAHVKAEVRSRSNSFTKKNAKTVVDRVLTKIFPTEEEGKRSRGHSFGMQPYRQVWFINEQEFMFITLFDMVLNRFVCWSRQRRKRRRKNFRWKIRIQITYSQFWSK